MRLLIIVISLVSMALSIGTTIYTRKTKTYLEELDRNKTEMQQEKNS